MSDKERNEPQAPQGGQSQNPEDSDAQEATGQERSRDRFWQVNVPDLVKQRIDVIKAQQSPGRKMLMALRKFYAILPVLVMGYFFFTSPTFQNAVLTILSFLAQLLFAIAYAIDRKSTRLNSVTGASRIPSSA